MYKTRYKLIYLLYIHIVTFSQQVEARGMNGKPGNAAEMAPKAKLMGWDPD